MTKRERPAAFYAAAGAGDLAYQRLRKLPEAASRTLRAAGQAATSLRERATSGEGTLNRDRLASDLSRLRETAQRGATAVLAGASVAQEKAVTGYRHLIAHGEQVVAARSGGPEAAPAEITVAGTETGPDAEPAGGTAPAGDVRPGTGAGPATNA